MTDLLNQTLAAASKDQPTTTTDGTYVERHPHGMRERRAQIITDDRGSLFEIWNKQWAFDDHPMEQVYVTTLRPNVVKGWSLHKTHEDRYFIVKGTMQVVLYDVRPDSPTRGHLFKLTLSDQARRLITIPTFVWHADYNVGQDECLLINMPTKIYNYADPDKWRLPIDTDLIPHQFPGAKGY
jgi:dTDP-4-dehydrorhamnose 3,5-epimerase